MNNIQKLLLMLVLAVSAACSGPAPQSFVKVEDGVFVKKGQRLNYIGANFWYGAILASEGQGGDRVRLAAELDSLKNLGINNLRVLVGGDGPDGIQTRIEPTLQKQPCVYNDTIFAGLDYLLVEMAKRDMQAVLYVNNTWEWSGGFGVYLEWAGAGPALIPSIDGYGPFMKQMAAYSTNMKAQELFAEHLRNVVSRTNSITGRPYSEDPTIFSWQICNEPRCFSADPAVRKSFTDWLWSSAALIKSIDHNHMVSTGSEGLFGCEQDPALLEAVHTCPDIDYLTIHIWPFNWGWVSKDTPENDIDNAISKTYDYIDSHLQLATNSHKPIVIEEFGFPRDGHAFRQGTATTGRDRYYSYIFSRIGDISPEYRMLAGCNFWAWGGLARQASDHDNWRRGDDYCGDPAQEEQGLNSVYLCDSSTVAVIREAAARVNAPSAEMVLEGDWMFTRGDRRPLRVAVSAFDDARHDVELKVLRDTDGSLLTSFDRKAAGGDTLSFRLDLEPGFYNVEIYVDGLLRHRGGIGCDPEAIVSPIDAQDDFDQFWSDRLGELAQTAPQYRLALMPEHSDDVRRTYRVDMVSWGGEPITGVLCEPVAEGCYPVMVSFLGYDCQPWFENPSASPQRIDFTLCTRAQGLSRDFSEPADFCTRGLSSRDTYYYGGAFLDCVRGIDFVCSLPKADMNRIYAGGGSQGGAFTLAAASLDHRIRAIAPFVPFLSDYPDYFNIVSWPGNEILAAAEKLGMADEDLYRTLSYFDIKNLAGRIECPVLMGFGLQDGVCPPHTNFAGYNMIRSDKRWVCFPRSGHHVEKDAGWWAARDRFFAENQ